MIDSKTAQELRNLAKRTTGEEFKMIVLEMLEESTAEGKTAPNEKEDNDKKIYTIFQELGIPANVKGYDYLMEAVTYCLSKGGNKCSLKYELYPAVAKKFDTVPHRVERNICKAIELWCDKTGTCKEVEKYFGNVRSLSRDKPTNSEFIYTIATWIQHNT